MDNRQPTFVRDRLPFGKRSLAKIQQERDVVHRLMDASVLLEFLMVEYCMQEEIEVKRTRRTLGNIVKDNKDLFDEDLLRRVNSGLRTRNRVLHHNPLKASPKRRDIIRASNFFISAITDVSKLVSPDIAKIALGSPSRGSSLGESLVGEARSFAEQTERLVKRWNLPSSGGSWIVGSTVVIGIALLVVLIMSVIE